MTAQAYNFPKVRAGGTKRMLGTPRTIMALVLREMSTTYGRSPGGYLWAVLDPIGGIAILTLVFTLFLRRPPLGDNFALFYATGYLPFIMYNTVSSRISASLQFSRALLSYPSVTFIDAILARLILNVLTSAIVMVVVFTGIIVIFHVRVNLNLPAAFLGIAMSAAVGAGVGTLNCYIMMAFAPWAQIWSVLSRPMFLISCIFFLFEGLPEVAKTYLWWNPLVHVVAETRRGFYSTYEGAFVSPAYVFLFSLCTFTLGLLLLRRHYRKLANEG